MRSIHISEAPGIYHAAGCDGADYTLCGAATDGENGDAEVKPSTRRINCERCIAIIITAKRFKMKDLALSTKEQGR